MEGGYRTTVTLKNHCQPMINDSGSYKIISSDPRYSTVIWFPLKFSSAGSTKDLRFDLQLIKLGVKDCVSMYDGNRKKKMLTLA
jgi:hypothetical protein